MNPFVLVALLLCVVLPVLTGLVVYFVIRCSLRRTAKRHTSNDVTKPYTV